MVLQPGYPTLLSPSPTPKNPNPITLNHPENFRRVTKATILVKKKEGLSDEEFVKHYCDVHAQMARSVLERHGCEGYSIVSCAFFSERGCVKKVVKRGRRREVRGEGGKGREGD